MASLIIRNNLDILDEVHKSTFGQALMNILSTDVAEFTYAQILDGLPTEDSLREGYPWMEGHPVNELEHQQLCAGFIDKAREFRIQFDLSQLNLDDSVRLPSAPHHQPFLS